MSLLPFAHLNLRRNPFGELSAAERVELAVLDIEESVRHLKSGVHDRTRPALQMLGDQGFGKSTHLLALAARFPGSAYLYIAEGERARIPDHGEPLLIDEAQRLTLWQRIRLFRSGRTLVLGTHRDFSPQLQRAGRTVLTLTADRHTTAGRVAEILNARIQAARRGDGPVPSIRMETAERLFGNFGPDLRSIQHSLYEVFQKLGSVEDV